MWTLGLFEYVRDWSNLFDFVVVMLSIIDILELGPSFLMMKGFRLLRIFKLIKSWNGPKLLLNTIIKTLPSVGNVGLLLLLHLYFFALIGKTYFSGDVI